MLKRIAVRSMHRISKNFDLFMAGHHAAQRDEWLRLARDTRCLFGDSPHTEEMLQNRVRWARREHREYLRALTKVSP